MIEIVRRDINCVEKLFRKFDNELDKLNADRGEWRYDERKVTKMATYRIKAQYEYEGDIEADSPEEAEKLFVEELNSYYAGTYSYDCDEICAECGEEIEDCVCDDEEEEED